MKNRKRNQSKNTHLGVSWVPNLLLFHIGFHNPPGNCPLLPRPAVVGSHSRLFITPSAIPCFLRNWPQVEITLVLATMEATAFLARSEIILPFPAFLRSPSWHRDSSSSLWLVSRHERGGRDIPRRPSRPVSNSCPSCRGLFYSNLEMIPAHEDCLLRMLVQHTNQM